MVIGAPGIRNALKRRILATLVLAALLSLPLAAAHKPLSQAQVDGLVRGGVASQRIANLIHQRGISFEVTPAFLQSLRKEGAPNELLDELRKENLKPVTKAPPSLDHSAEALQYQLKGKQFFDRQHWSEAEAELRKSIKLNPNDAAAHFYLGRVLSEEGKPDDAIAQYREAVLLAPDSVPARVNLANELLDRRDFDGAIEQYRDSINLNPDDAQARYALGVALCDKGDDSGATSELRAALRLDPSNEKTHLALGLVLAKENKIEPAIREYRRALKINPQDAVAHADLASALVAKGDNQEALLELRTAISLAPLNVRYHASYEKLVSQIDPPRSQ